MPQQIEVPGIGTVEFPDGMTDEQIASAIRENLSSAEKPREKPSGFTRGLKDPITGGAQLLTHLLPESVVDAGNKLNNWLADKGVPLAKIPEGGLDALVRQEESDYQKQRSAAGETGIDWARVAGNVVNPANLAIASKIPQAATLAGRIGLGAASGAGFSAAQPVSGNDYWTEKAKQIGAGAVTGAVLPAVTGAAARIIRPKTDPNALALMKEGVQPTVGQTLGGISKGIEEKVSSAPFIGDAIKGAQARGIESFNRAAINRSLKPIGDSLPKQIPVGREGVQYAIDKLSSAYDDVLPNLSGKIDKAFTADLSRIRSMVSSLPKNQQRQFDNIIKTQVTDKFTSHGLASGETLKSIESQLGRFARGYSRSQDFDVNQLGAALGEVQSSLRNMLTRQNPQFADRLSKINSGYANLMRVQRAAGSTAAQGGVFTPTQLNLAVKALDKSKNNRAFATGKALMQDLSSAGKGVLSQTVPNSGTVDRALLAYLLTNPVKGTLAAGAGLIGGGLYSPFGQRVLNSVVASRPQFAAPLAEAVRQSTPLLAPGAIPIAYGLLH